MCVGDPTSYVCWGWWDPSSSRNADGGIPVAAGTRMVGSQQQQERGWWDPSSSRNADGGIPAAAGTRMVGSQQ
eukprot:gene21905-biopygen2690